MFGKGVVLPGGDFFFLQRTLVEVFEVQPEISDAPGIVVLPQIGSLLGAPGKVGGVEGLLEPDAVVENRQVFLDFLLGQLGKDGDRFVRDAPDPFEEALPTVSLENFPVRNELEGLLQLLFRGLERSFELQMQGKNRVVVHLVEALEEWVVAFEERLRVPRSV